MVTTTATTATTTTAATQITAALRTATPTTLTNKGTAAAYVHELLRVGLRLIPVDPHEDEKRPLWNMGHADATNDRQTWDSWLSRLFPDGSPLAAPSGEPWGLSVTLGACPAGVLVVLDADKLKEVADAVLVVGEVPPTTRTPGRLDRSHADGGHWLCLLPHGTVPPETPAAVEVGTAMIYTRSRHIILPPTRRAAGAYEVAGEVLAAPPAVLERLEVAAAEAREQAAERAARKAAGGGSSEELEAWEDSTEWDSILTLAGWEETGADAQCGCSQWRHPEASSQKSATAHDCARGCYLHMWSSSCSALEAGSYSKSFVYAALHHGGDYNAAMTAAGIPAVPKLDTSGLLGFPEPDALTTDTTDTTTQETPAVTTAPAVNPFTGAAVAETPGALAERLAAAVALRAGSTAAVSVVAQLGPDEARVRWADLIALGADGLEQLARNIGRERADAVRASMVQQGKTIDLNSLIPTASEMDALIAQEAGTPVHAGLFYRTGLHVLGGAAASGKTWLALDAATPSAPPLVMERDTDTRWGMYIDADGNGMHTLVQRSVLLGTPRWMIESGNLRLVSVPALARQTKQKRLAAVSSLITTLEALPDDKLPQVIIVDSMTQLLAMDGLTSNDDVDVTSTLARWRDLSERTCVVIIDHIGHGDKTRLRGSTAKADAVDVVLLMTKLEQTSAQREEYPDTAIRARIDVVKDRAHGIESELCADDGDKMAATWVLEDDPTRLLEVGGKYQTQKSIRLIPAKASAEKRAREAEETAKAVPLRVAGVVREAGGEVRTTKALLEALTTGTAALSRREAKDAVAAALSAGAIIKTTAPGNADLYRLM